MKHGRRGGVFGVNIVSMVIVAGVVSVVQCSRTFRNYIFVYMILAPCMQVCIHPVATVYVCTVHAYI